MQAGGTSTLQPLCRAAHPPVRIPLECRRYPRASLRVLGHAGATRMGLGTHAVDGKASLWQQVHVRHTQEDLMVSMFTASTSPSCFASCAHTQSWWARDAPANASGTLLPPDVLLPGPTREATTVGPCL